MTIISAEERIDLSDFINTTIHNHTGSPGLIAPQIIDHFDKWLESRLSTSLDPRSQFQKTVAPHKFGIKGEDGMLVSVSGRDFQIVLSWEK